MVSARRLVLLALAFVVGLAASCAVSGAASASTWRLTSTETAVVKLLNQTRAQHGLRPLQVRRSLCRAARSHSREMLRRDFFSHLSFNGESQVARVLRCGYSPKGCASWRTGELIGYGTGSASTPRAIVKAWLRSKPHRALLLDRRWRDVGVGRACGSFHSRSGTSLFTVDLGRRTY
jgi:uncharacterized protein YkwD